MAETHPESRYGPASGARLATPTCTLLVQCGDYTSSSLSPREVDAVILAHPKLLKPGVSKSTEILTISQDP